MKDENGGLRCGVRASRGLLGWGLVVAFTLVGCAKQQTPETEPAATMATEGDERQSASHENALGGAATFAQLTQAVTFIRSNAARRQEVARACRQMQLCTHFQPANRGGEQGVILSIPEDAKECVLSRSPECQSALDELAKHPAPEPIRADYVKWAYASNELQLQISRMALDLMEQRRLNVRREGDGYQDFWKVWAARYFPDQSEQALTLMARADATHEDGEQSLERWLTEHDVCRDGARCTPAAVENGVGISERFE